MKRIKSLLLAVVFGLAALCAGLPAFLLPASQPAHAAAISEISTKMPEFTITNEDFSKNTPTTGNPVTPSDWTGALSGNITNQEIKSGLVNLQNADKSQKDWGLEKAVIPSVADAGDDSSKNNKYKALLINSENKNTIYSYTSASFDVAPNSRLHISFKAHANVTEGQAIARIATDELDVTQIAVKSDAKWTEYNIYIKSHAYRTIKTSLVFSLGSEKEVKDENNEATTEYETARGYFMVRDIQTMLITPSDYKTDETRFSSMTDTFMFASADVVDESALSNDIENPTNDKWTVEGNFRTINTIGYTNTVDNVKLPSPGAPFSDDNRVVAIQGTTSKPNTVSMLTKDSNEITIPRFGFVRISLWGNTAALTSGTVTMSVIKGTADDEDAETNEEEGTTDVTGFSAQNSASWTGNWGEGVVFVKGSAFHETTVKIKLSASSLVGEVYFDHLTYSYVDGKDYTDASNKLEMAAAPIADTIPNGNFNLNDTYSDKDVLLPATNWTTELASRALGGIIGMDDANFYDADFAQKRESIGLSTKPKMLANGKMNAYVLLNRESGASSIKSEEFSAPSASGSDGSTTTTTPKPYHNVIVTAANRMDKPTSVKIQLLLEDKVIAERNDVISREFQDYEFNVKVDPAKTYKYKLVIAAGDKNDETTFTSGSLWLARVYIGTSETVGSSIGTKVVDISGDMFSSVKTDDLIAENYGWEAVKNNETAANLGFIQMKRYPANVDERYSEMFKGANNDYGMLIHANEDSSIGFTQSFPITYTDGTFVKVTLRLKTREFEKGVGATIRLGDKAVIENVNSQHLKAVDLTTDILTGGEYSKTTNIYSGWQEYSFYVNVGTADTDATETNDNKTENTDEDKEDEETASTITTALKIMVGDNISSLRKGIVLVDSVTVETIDETAFTAIGEELDKNDTEKIPSNKVSVNLRDAAKSTVTGSTSPNEILDTDLMLTILGSVLAGIVGLILLISFIRYLVDRRRAKAAPTTTTKTVSYDRSNVERNYESGSGYAPAQEVMTTDEDDEFFETEKTTAPSKKQPRTMHQFKKQQKRKEAEKNSARLRKNRRGLTPEQDIEFVESVVKRDLPHDDVNDFE